MEIYIRIDKEIDLHLGSIQGWIRKYKTFGPKCLRTTRKNTYHTNVIKHVNLIQKKGYNIMTKGRKTTYE